VFPLLAVLEPVHGIPVAVAASAPTADGPRANHLCVFSLSRIGSLRPSIRSS
jgi:hypothetical protein